MSLFTKLVGVVALLASLVSAQTVINRYQADSLTYDQLLRLTLRNQTRDVRYALSTYNICAEPFQKDSCTPSGQTFQSYVMWWFWDAELSSTLAVVPTRAGLPPSWPSSPTSHSNGLQLNTHR